MRTWTHSSGQRAYLTADYVNYTLPDGQGGTIWRYDTRLNLLRATSARGGRPLGELRSTYRFANQYVSDLVVHGNSLFVNASPVYSYAGGVAAGGGPARASALTNEDVSDRLVAFDLGQFDLDRVYDEATGTQGVQFMGTYRNQLFVSISGDGILAIDVSNPTHPVGKNFLRTLGWATHVVFAGDDAYVAAGYFGIYRMGLTDPTALPLTN